MIGQITATTTRIRVGSGGVMLPNHAPLMVAERFKVLEALFPGRIDLGIGRAPGTDPVTSYALRRRQDGANSDDFLERFQELLLFERGRSKGRRGRLCLGTRETVVGRLAPLVKETKADEVMVTTMIYDHGARRHSYELLARAFGLRAS